MQPLINVGGEGLSGHTLTMKAVQRPLTQNRCGFPRLGMIRHLTNGLAWALKKGVASCDKLRVGASGLRSGDTRMGLPVMENICDAPYGSGNLPNGSIQVGRGRETNWDSLTSSERKGKSSNRIPTGNRG